MVLIGGMGVFLSFYAFWFVAQVETKWLQKLLVVCCGFIFATALLWIGYGLERGEIIYNRSVALPVWVIGKH